jgi:septal ring factor EnvC (AmiA/AmiB activator)
VSHLDTQRLTRASLELSSRDERRRRTATFVTVLVTLLAAGGGAFYLREGGAAPFAASAASPALSQENAALRADLERVRTELDMEKATRAELNREAGELHARINELTNRLEFLAARDTRVDQPR